MLAYSLKVASVAQTWSRAVACLVAHVLESVVLHIAVGKAVGHEHIQHVFVAEAYAFVACHSAVFQLVLHLLGLLALLETQCHLASLCTLKVEVDQQIVGRVESCYRIDTHSGIFHFHIGVAHILAVHHKLQ